MQSLTIWPSLSDWNSFVIPQSGLELCSCNTFFNWGDKRKRLSFCHISCRGVVCFGCYCKGFRSSANFIGRDSGLNPLSKPKKGCRGTAVAFSWALEEQTVGGDVAKQELNRISGLSENREGIEFTQVQLDDVVDGRAEHADKYDGDIGSDGGHDNREGIDRQNSGIDLGDKDQDGTNAKIDVRALSWKLRTAKTADDAEEVLKEMGELPLQVYSTIIKCFGRDKRLESAMAVFEWLKRKSKDEDCPIQPNLYVYNSLLGAMKQAARFDFVEEVVSDMAMEGVHPNVVTYNTLMGIYIEQGREMKALNLFIEMPNRGVSPSPVSYSTVLLAYRRLEDGLGALTFFVEVRDKFLKGDFETYADEDWDNEIAKLENFTIRICYQVMRRWLVTSENPSTKVLKLLKEIDKAGLKPSRTEYERLIWACTRGEHCPVAKELYTRLREMGSEISLSVCNHVIWLMGKAKKWWAALEVYEDLLDKGPKPNNMSYELVISHFNILLTAAQKRGIWRWGIQLLDKMEEKGLKPGSREWNSVLIACAKASETSAAVGIFKRMVEQGEKPTVISYGALLSALEKGKLYDEALQVWKHMVKVGVEPNLYTYTIMASIHATQGKFDIVDSIIHEMVTVGVEPTVVTFNAVISCCARNNMGSTAYEWFQRMNLHNITPNEVTYGMLIEALANDSKPRLAYELYLRARNEGLELSAKAYDAVIQSAQTYGATVDVNTMGPRPPERAKSADQEEKHGSI